MRILKIAIAVLLFGGLGIGIVWWFFWRDGPPPPEDTPRIEVPSNAHRVEETFETGAALWQVVDGSWNVQPAGVFVQTATDRAFPVALLRAHRFRDVDVSVRFRPISGSEDASGGIVFRAHDSRNYYVVRANSLEDNVRLYTVIDGDRSKIDGSRYKAPSLGKWHTLRVVAVGDHIQAFLDERIVIDHRNSRFRSGQVGLWTKADAVTEFDDFIVRGTAP